VETNRSSIGYEETTHPQGAIGGVQIGYNWQGVSNWIFGLEADFQASGEDATGNVHQNTTNVGGGGGSSGSGSFGFEIFNSQSISHNDRLDWFGTVRGRVGYAIWPTVMLYGTGGLAYGRLSESVSASSAITCVCVNAVPVNFPSASQSFETSVTKTGWTVGGGIEGVVSNTHVTWKVEYLYMDLGTANYTFNSSGLGTITLSTHFTDNIVRVGLNYQFH